MTNGTDNDIENEGFRPDPEGGRRVKRGALIALLGGYALLGGFSAALGAEWGRAPALQLFGSAVTTAGALAWCLGDSQENDHPFGWTAGILLVLLVPAGLLYYFVPSRGWGEGLKRMLGAIVFTLVLLGVMGLARAFVLILT